MADAGWTNRLGATPGKLGTVALLAVALGAVVLLQGSHSSAPANMSQEPSDARRKPRLPERAVPKVSVAAPSTPQADTPRRPEVSWEEASQHDPFALVGTLAELVAAQSSESNETKAPHGRAEDRDQRIKQAIAALHDKGVQLVLLGKEEKLAIVGNRSVRVGDMLDGFRVISINLQGITLSDQDDQQP